jgi:hypothetical protein
MSHDNGPPPDIVPQRSPTVLRPLSLTFSEMSFDGAFSPLEGEACEPWQQQATEYGQNPFTNDLWSNQHRNLGRSGPERGMDATDSSELPSLVHSVSSSVASVVSLAQSRPRPSRHNKSYSAYSTPAMDLVTPCLTEQKPSPSQLLHDSSVKSGTTTIACFQQVEGRSVQGASPCTTSGGTSAPR